MVTLRRDIAAAAQNKVFDRKDRDSKVLTDYDIFMEKKKQQKYFCDYKPVDDTPAKEEQSKKSCEKSKNDIFERIFNKAPEQQESVALTQDINDEYKSYLIQQLHRAEPAALLDKDDFYKRLAPQPALVKAAKAAKSKHAPKRLSKNGKIFIAVYVLVVAIVASIILAVNSASQPTTVDASAAGDNAAGITTNIDLPIDILG